MTDAMQVGIPPQVEELVAATQLTLAPEHLAHLDRSGLDASGVEEEQ